MNNAKIMQSRANMYRFLARMYKKEIDAPLFEQLKIMFPANVQEINGLAQGYGQLGCFLAQAAGNVLTDLAADYAKVFLAAGSNQGLAAVPYESIYTSPKRIVMQEAWEQVRAIYQSQGLVLGDVSSDYMEDHVACELEYMAWLCGEGKIDAQIDFMQTHLLAWIPAFYEDILKYADTDFYKEVGKITLEYLKADAELLPVLKEANDAAGHTANEACTKAFKSYELNTAQMDTILAALSEKYKIYAPKLFPNRGAKKGTDLVRYGEISSVKEIVYDRQSDFSAKEVLYPVMQTMIYFTETDCTVSEIDGSKDLLIFAHPCDINGIQRLDQIFLNNGQADLYYQRMRERVKFVMMECLGSFEHCFCVSMGTNKTNDYSAAVKLSDENISVAVADSAFAEYFEILKVNVKNSDYVPNFVTENVKKAVLPKIPDRETLKAASQLEFWNKYDEQCIGCGGCNTVCMTCSCFDTVDVIYNEGSRDGERRRVWSSCMLEDFTKTAGGARARKTPGANMRFKALHKVYDYNARFGGDAHMCVGCGRCDIRCPKEISFFDVISTLNSELENAVREGK